MNESAVTGGSPILAFGKDSPKVLFEDMLGSSMGSVENGKFNAINRTSFGELESGDSELNFFTGKPQVQGLGYAFLFRNYRADQGKWQTSDPIGYPDGWNNLAYCNNGVTSCIDWMGASNLEGTPENVIMLGGVNFFVKVSGVCNDDYDNPAITNVSANIYGTISDTITSSCYLGGVTFPAGSTVSISGVSGSVTGSPTITTDQANRTKTITVSVYISYTITVTGNGITNVDTYHTTLSLSATIKE